MKHLFLSRIAGLALCMLSLSACQQHDLPQTSPTNTTPEAGKSIELQFEGEALSFVYDQSQARMIGLAFDESHPKYLPHIDVQGASFNTILYFRKKGSTNPADFFTVTLKDSQWEVRKFEKGADNVGKIYLSTLDGSTYAAPNLKVPAGKNAPVTGETWEIAAILGESDAPFSVPGIQGKDDGVFWVQGPRIATAVSQNMVTKSLPKVTMNIPYYSAWKEITIEAGSTVQAKFNAKLHFISAGALVHYRIERTLNSLDKANMDRGILPSSGPVHLLFSTNLGTLFGAGEFRQGDNDFHWVGLDRSQLTNDPNFTPIISGWNTADHITQPDPSGYAVPQFHFNGEAPVHILAFVVPAATAVANPLTTLKRYNDLGTKDHIGFHFLRKEEVTGSNDSYKSQIDSHLRAVERGKVHYGVLVTKSLIPSPQ